MTEPSTPGSEPALSDSVSFGSEGFRKTISPPSERMRIGHLPRDMREELFNEHATNTDPDATEIAFFAKNLPMGYVYIDDLLIDRIPSEQLKRYLSKDVESLPPLVISDNRLIDGQHRIAAGRLQGKRQMKYVDATGVIDTNAGGFLSTIPDFTYYRVPEAPASRAPDTCKKTSVRPKRKL